MSRLHLVQTRECRLIDSLGDKQYCVPEQKCTHSNSMSSLCMCICIIYVTQDPNPGESHTIERGKPKEMPWYDPSFNNRSNVSMTEKQAKGWIMKTQAYGVSSRPGSSNRALVTTEDLQSLPNNSGRNSEVNKQIPPLVA